MLLFQEQYMLPCLSKKLFGFECLGCGLQRSINLLFKAEFYAAFKMYPAIYTLIPLAVIITISIFYKFKYVNKIINALSIASVLIIIVSFMAKKLI